MDQVKVERELEMQAELRVSENKTISDEFELLHTQLHEINSALELISHRYKTERDQVNNLDIRDVSS